MERLKVLFISTSYPTKEDPVGGVFVREHAKAVMLYDDVRVLHCVGTDLNLRRLWRMRQETDESLTEGIPTYRVWYHGLPIPKIWYFFFSWVVFQAFRKVASEGFRPHIIHAHFYDVGVPAVLIGKFYDTPVVVTEHFTGFLRKTIRGLESWKAKFAFEKADLVMPVSKSLQKSIEGYGINANFEVVPNVVDTNLFNPGPYPQLDNQLNRLLFVGLLDASHKKGVPYLLTSLSMLRQLRDDWLLDIVGDGPARQEYERMAEDLGLHDKIEFHGLKSKQEISEFMRQADIFVLPSIWENLPCVLIEAMACGLPIVSTFVGGIPELIDDGTGILIPPGDADKLLHALVQMMESLNGFDRHAIAQTAIQYSPESVGGLIHSIYEDCLRR